MSAFKIGGFPSRPTSEIAGSKKLKAKETAQQSAAPTKSAFDTASVNPNRLAVMPRMSTITSGSAQQIKSETVESMLRDSAAELDDYFTKAYGFEPDAE
ncbi:MAG: hypothetical protein E7425_06745 [Ruminococcaceae bacterium]|nr:hypothetical protein [Oscillospiraceae bacterium]